MAYLKPIKDPFYYVNSFAFVLSLLVTYSLGVITAYHKSKVLH